MENFKKGGTVIEPTATYIDTSDIENIKNDIHPSTKAIFLETPTNPLLKISNIKEIAYLAKEHQLLSMEEHDRIQRN